MLRVLSLCALGLSLLGQSASYPGHVTGRVVDAAGAAIADATVSLRESPLETAEAVATTRTDANGAFELVLPPQSANYQLWVEKQALIRVNPPIARGEKSVDVGNITLMVAMDYPLAPQEAHLIEIPTPISGVRNTSICEIATNPAEWNERTVSLSATVRIAFEQFDISAEGCPERKLDAVWLEYAEGPKKQPTVWCCGDLTRGGQPTLKQDAEFRKFHRLLTAQRRAKDCLKDYCFANDVSARLTGRLETARTQLCADGEHYCCPEGGFGHIGFSCARLVIQQVADVKATRRR
jgi:hypothetical protein